MWNLATISTSRDFQVQLTYPPSSLPPGRKTERDNLGMELPEFYNQNVLKLSCNECKTVTLLWPQDLTSTVLKGGSAVRLNKRRRKKKARLDYHRALIERLRWRQGRLTSIYNLWTLTSFVLEDIQPIGGEKRQTQISTENEMHWSSKTRIFCVFLFAFAFFAFCAHV